MSNQNTQPTTDDSNCNAKAIFDHACEAVNWGPPFWDAERDVFEQIVEFEQDVVFEALFGARLNVEEALPAALDRLAAVGVHLASEDVDVPALAESIVGWTTRQVVEGVQGARTCAEDGDQHGATAQLRAVDDALEINSRPEGWWADHIVKRLDPQDPKWLARLRDFLAKTPAAMAHARVVDNEFSNEDDGFSDAFDDEDDEDEWSDEYDRDEEG